jgi:hypothetical protein
MNSNGGAVQTVKVRRGAWHRKLYQPFCPRINRVPVLVYLWWQVKGLITMPPLPLTTYPTNRVQGQEGNLDYYIKTSLFSLPMRRCHMPTLIWGPSVDGQCDASGF